jgi:hypothetical protein
MLKGFRFFPLSFATLLPYAAEVRSLHFIPLLFLCALLAGCSTAPKVVKVLPHLRDREGRIALSPSLYDRDAYQAQLRAQPAERSGLQFDIQWRAPATGRLKLMVEMRGALSNQITTARMEVPLRSGGKTSRWAKATLVGEDYTKFGDLAAWRVSLWNGGDLLAEQRSFLWAQ